MNKYKVGDYVRTEKGRGVVIEFEYDYKYETYRYLIAPIEDRFILPEERLDLMNEKPEVVRWKHED